MPRKQRYIVCLIAISLTFSTLCAGQQLWSGVLSPQRGVPWTYAGIQGGGGIPSGSWTQCGATIAPYGSSGSPASPSTIINAVSHTGSGYTSCGPNTYIQLGAGTFYLNAGIRIKGVSNTELRGMGANQTTLAFSGTTVCAGGDSQCMVSFEDNNGEYASGNPPGTAWTGGYAQGATSITVASAANITANSTILVLDQCDTGYSGDPCSGSAVDNGNYFNCSDAYTGSTGCSYNSTDGGVARDHRFQQEYVLVTGCSQGCGNSGSGTLTITPPLQHPNWSSAQTPEYWTIQANSNVGLQNFTVQASGVTQGTNAIDFNNVWNFWVRGVAVLHANSQGIGVYQVTFGDIESNYIFDSGQSQQAGGRDPNPWDPSGIDYLGSNLLIANNILQYQRLATVGNGPSSGNVIAYNFAINCYESNSYLWGCIWDGHSGGNNYNLFEGNVANQVFSDQTHGGKLMQTFYRNFFTGWESCANGNCEPNPVQSDCGPGISYCKDDNVSAANPFSYNRYGNWVANVLGTPGGPSSGGYVSITNNGGNGLPGTNGYIFELGSGNACGGSGSGCVATAPIPADPVVPKTTMVWGNWDAYNNATLECTGAGAPIAACPADERGDGVSVYSGLSSPATIFPASFYYTSRPSWWSSATPFPAIGPDVTGGNVGQCTGTPNKPGEYGGVAATSSSQCTGTSLTTAWAGHVNAIPAMNCYLSVMNGPPDGSGSALTFDADTCYGATTGAGGGATPPAAPTGLQATVQ